MKRTPLLTSRDSYLDDYRRRLIDSGLDPATASAIVSKTTIPHSIASPSETSRDAQHQVRQALPAQALVPLTAQLEVVACELATKREAQKGNPRTRSRMPTPKSLSGRQRKLLDHAVTAEQHGTAERKLGYLPTVLAQLTLPHRDPCIWHDGLADVATLYYSRTNGLVTLTIRGHRQFGIPFGTKARQVLLWICTEAYYSKSPILTLGRTASDFSRKLGIAYNGRDLAELKRQLLALARALISIDVRDTNGAARAFEDIKIASRGLVFWRDSATEKPCKWESTLVLSDDFFQLVTANPMPVDLTGFNLLRKSPLSTDIYIWLTYRMFRLRRSRKSKALIPWKALQAQLGGDYATDAKGLQNFRSKFMQRLREVLLFYPQATSHVEDVGDHLRLTPGPLHIWHPAKASPSARRKPRKRPS